MDDSIHFDPITNIIYLFYKLSFNKIHYNLDKNKIRLVSKIEFSLAMKNGTEINDK